MERDREQNLGGSLVKQIKLENGHEFEIRRTNTLAHPGGYGAFYHGQQVGGGKTISAAARAAHLHTGLKKARFDRAMDAVEAALSAAGCEQPWQFMAGAWDGNDRENVKYDADPAGYIEIWLNAYRNHDALDTIV